MILYINRLVNEYEVVIIEYNIRQQQGRKIFYRLPENAEGVSDYHGSKENWYIP